MLALLAGLNGCSASSQPGVEVRVLSMPTGLAPAYTLQNDLGVEVRLQELTWVSAEIEIRPCESVAERLGSLFVGTAHAHGTAAPTQLATPIVESAFSTGEVALGVLAPPAQSYCALRQALGPADHDAVGLEQAPQMRGLSLRAVGSFQTTEQPARNFVLESALPISVTRPIELELTSTERSSTLRIEREPQRWFDGIDLLGGEPATNARTLLSNLGESLLVRAQ